MQITISDPVLETFIAQQVSAGHFASAEELVVAAVERMNGDIMGDSEGDFDADTIAQLQDSMDQAARGETVTVEEAAARLGVSLTPKKRHTGAA